MGRRCSRSETRHLRLRTKIAATCERQAHVYYGEPMSKCTYCNRGVLILRDYGFGGEKSCIICGRSPAVQVEPIERFKRKKGKR